MLTGMLGFAIGLVIGVLVGFVGRYWVAKKKG
jgi:hypothetical protein